MFHIKYNVILNDIRNLVLSYTFTHNSKVLLEYKFNFIYIAHLKTIMVDQSASRYPEKLPHKQNKYSKNVTMSQLKIKAKEYRCLKK